MSDDTVQDAAESAGMNQGIRITFAGRTATLWPNRLGANDAQMVRKQVGMSLRELLDTLGDSEAIDIDIVAALIWLARRQSGEPRLRFDHVAPTVSYGSATDELEIEFLGPDGEVLDADGEADELVGDEGEIAGN